MLGGYSILSFPIAMASAHFIIPYVINGIQPTINSLIISSLWTLGIPLLMMAFIIPVVLLNEAAQRRAGGFIQSFARRLAAGEVEIPIISSKGAEKETPEEPAGEPLDF